MENNQENHGEIKSEIGVIVDRLFRDKYPENKLDILDKKDRVKLQKELAQIKYITHRPEVILSPGIYNLDGSLQEPPMRYEDEICLNEH